MAEQRPTKKSKLDEKEPSVKLDWKKIPYVLLVDIYSYLSPDDQYKMTRVCEEWAKGIKSTYLWESFVFALKKENLDVKPWPMMKYVEENAQFIKHVYIDYRLPTGYYIATNDREMVRTWLIQCRKFIEHLTAKSQLISIEFQSLMPLLIILPQFVAENMCKSIDYLFERQFHLERVKFICCNFEYREGIRFLKTLMKSSGKSLSHLALPGFVEKRSQYEEPEQILPELLDLPKLEVLEMQYKLVLGEDANVSDVLKVLESCKRKMVLKMILTVDNYLSKYKVLETEDWKHLKQVNPDLELRMHLHTSSLFRLEAENFIVEDMPITLLFFTHERCPDTEINLFIDHLFLCKSYKHLERLYLYVTESIPHLAVPFVPFIVACPKLTELLLSAVYPVSGLNVLLESLVQKKLDTLKKVSLRISNVGNEDNKAMLTELTSGFVKELNLNVKLFL